MRTDKHPIEPFGSDQGHAGGVAPASSIQNQKESLPSRFGDHALRHNDIVRVDRPGGGGLGNPLRRPIEKVLEDLRQGYVSVARAQSDYGVAAHIVDGEPILHEGETAHLRGKID